MGFAALISRAVVLRGLTGWLLMLLASQVWSQSQPLPAEPSRWQEAIDRFLAEDRERPVAPGGILFVGSSTIRLWDLPKYLPDQSAVNRGFGGSQMSDVLRHVEEIVIPYRPRIIVLYEGDNDIAAGKSPRQVWLDFRELTDRIHAALPGSHVIFLSIKPSTARWEKYDLMRQANRLIRTYAEQHAHLHFVEVAKVMLDDAGRPRADLLVKDGLHLNDAGYRLWSELVRNKIAEVNARLQP